MKKVLIGCFGLIAVLVIAGVIAVMMLPSEYEAERSAVIPAPPAEVYAVVADLHTWPEWSAWSQEKDPDCVWSYNDKTGVGARTDWEGPELGKGYMVVTEAIDDTKFACDLGFFIEEEELKSKIYFEFTPKGDDTDVRWVMFGELEGIGKVFGLMIDASVGPDFEEGLAGLKDRFETGS